MHNVLAPKCRYISKSVMTKLSSPIIVTLLVGCLLGANLMASDFRDHELEPHGQLISLVNPHIPDEILLNTLKFLPPEDIISVSSTCKRLNAISNDLNLAIMSFVEQRWIRPLIVSSFKNGKGVLFDKDAMGGLEYQRFLAHMKSLDSCNFTRGFTFIDNCFKHTGDISKIVTLARFKDDITTIEMGLDHESTVVKAFLKLSVEQIRERGKVIAANREIYAVCKADAYGKVDIISDLTKLSVEKLIALTQYKTYFFTENMSSSNRQMVIRTCKDLSLEDLKDRSASIVAHRDVLLDCATGYHRSEIIIKLLGHSVKNHKMIAEIIKEYLFEALRDSPYHLALLISTLLEYPIEEIGLIVTSFHEDFIDNIREYHSMGRIVKNGDCICLHKPYY